MLLSTDLDKYMLPCYSKRVLGMDCPGCGLQRSVAFLLEGEFVQAFYMYPAIYPMLLFFGFVLVNIFVEFKYATKIISILGIATVALVLINYFLKFV
ncbi:DUF2752 domain-containing protein [Sediminicola luteus]|uniref:DUF2752 domain-containing protein n=1 Tax=Sediminicola luteus TaxID=319238 RepID=A0A2A4GA79_9FLAO|nr:DUF2752 domain-containing protein [Sediminicola luteus]PCE64886.1 hypothetical protein B7P33_06905 [Sediminicola luteus]